jgi:H+/Cl- antiporter ClcA
MGGAAMLSGSCRMTFSLAVIMLETTSNVNLFVPMILALFISYGTGSLFNKSIYTGTLRSKNIPVLDQRIPK